MGNTEEHAINYSEVKQAKRETRLQWGVNDIKTIKTRKKPTVAWVARAFGYYVCGAAGWWLQAEGLEWRGGGVEGGGGEMEIGKRRGTRAAGRLSRNQTESSRATLGSNAACEEAKPLAKFLQSDYVTFDRTGIAAGSPPGARDLLRTITEIVRIKATLMSSMLHELGVESYFFHQYIRGALRRPTMIDWLTMKSWRCGMPMM